VEDVCVQHNDNSDDGAERNRVPRHKTENDTFIPHLVGSAVAIVMDCASTICPSRPCMLAAQISTGSMQVL